MTIKVFGKRLLVTYSHFYYKLSFQSFKPADSGRLERFEISAAGYDRIPLSADLKRMLEQQPGYVTGYGFTDQDGNVIGHVFLMTKGGNEVLYKIRNIDLYAFALRVFEPYRGNGYAGEIMSSVIDMLKNDSGKQELYLTVKKDNKTAIKIYERLGFEQIGTKAFVRVGKINIPYLTL